MRNLLRARSAPEIGRAALRTSTKARRVMRPECAISSDDRQHMRQALELAKRGSGKTHPNPAVGCVVLKDGKVGHHALRGNAAFAQQISHLDIVYSALPSPATQMYELLWSVQPRSLERGTILRLASLTLRCMR